MPLIAASSILIAGRETHGADLNLPCSVKESHPAILANAGVRSSLLCEPLRYLRLFVLQHYYAVIAD